MTYVHTLPYGQALCCACKTLIDLTTIQPFRVLGVCGRPATVYFFCSMTCAGRPSGSDLENILRSAATERALALISWPALIEHHGDPAAAYEYGSSLPEHIFRAVIEGNAQLTAIGGMLLVETGGDR